MVTPLAVAVSLVLFSGNVRAFGPGGAGNVGGANGTGVAGGTAIGSPAGGGSHGGVSAAPGSTGGRSVAPAVSGTRNGVSFSNNTPRVGTGTFMQGSGLRGNAPTSLSLPYHNVLNGPSTGSATRPAASQSTARPNNAWSGTAINAPNTAPGRDSSRSPYHSNGYAGNRFAGQILYPGTNGSNLPTTSGNSWTGRGNADNGRHNSRPFFRQSGRYSYYPYAYGPSYAPYIAYYGGGYPYYAGAYPYSNDVPTTDLDFGYANGPGTGVVNPQYVEQNQDAHGAQPEAAQTQPSGPAPQGQDGSTAAQGTIPNNGPDSLVEAVQQELIRRGYFGGKVDAMFGADTKEALRKFQTDHHLAETGLINEATLHALQLD